MNEIDYDGPGELWIADITKARSSSTTQFDRVITVCQEPIEDNISPEQQYHWYNMSDGDTGYGGFHDYHLFERATTQLYEALCWDESVLIHCHMGRSRSVSVSIAALGRLLSLSRFESYELVNRYRPQAQPNQLLLDHARRYIEQYTGIENDGLHIVTDNE